MFSIYYFWGRTYILLLTQTLSLPQPLRLPDRNLVWLSCSIQQAALLQCTGPFMTQLPIRCSCHHSTPSTPHPHASHTKCPSPSDMTLFLWTPGILHTLLPLTWFALKFSYESEEFVFWIIWLLFLKVINFLNFPVIFQNEHTWKDVFFLDVWINKNENVSCRRL